MTLAPRVFPNVALPAAPGPRGQPPRADIVLSGVDLSGGSYELRVFVGDPDADADTELSAEAGYAGSVYVYGYGRPPGAGGEAAAGGGSAVGGESAAEAHPHIPTTRHLIATEALQAAAASGQSTTVTVVPVRFEAEGPEIRLEGLEVSVLVVD